MKVFKYNGKTREGAPYKGKMEAKNKAQVVESLHRENIIVLSVQEDVSGRLSRLNEINIGGVPMKEKVIFMRQLSTMVSAGLPLSQALEILESQASNPQFKKVLGSVSDDVQNGTSLAAAFQKNEKVFDDITINLIVAGEDSGNLEQILLKLADELEKQKALKDKIRSAFVYPIVIFVVMVVVIVILMVFLVPTMAELYADFDSELPLPTRILISLSDGIVAYWWLILIIMGVIGILGKMFADSEGGKTFLSKFALKVPIYGNLITKIQVTQFTRVLSLLLQSGLSIIEALRLTAAALSNEVFRNVVLEAKNEVEKGSPIATPLSRSEAFPLIVSQMVAVGEESGEIDSILSKLAQYYDAEVEVLTNNLMTVLEPVILVVVGVIIAFIAVAIYLPMFQLVQVIG